MKTELLYDLIGVDPEAGPAELLFKARGTHYQLPYLVLSALAREGARMGEHARAELGRAETRARRYAELSRELAAATGVRAIKGLQLADRYPTGLLRPQGDLDLVAPTEAALWQATAQLLSTHPVEHVDITVFGTDPRHTMVTLFWPAEDALTDPWYKVELSTAALTGDLGAVPVRPVLSAPDEVECLIALAEEGLQRDFRHRDAVDVLMLAEATFDPTATATTVAEYRLAPEAAALLDFAAAYVPLGTLQAVRDALEPLIAQEQKRRKAPALAVTPRHGLFLRWAEPRRDWDEVRVLPFPGGELLLTPVADYLLTGQEVVSRTAHDSALRALSDWDGGAR